MSQAISPDEMTLRQHAAYICSRVLAYGLPLLFFLVSVSFYLKTYDSAQVKITFTQIGTTVLFAAWIVKICLEGKLPFSRKDMIYVLPFLAFLASGLISFIHSPFKLWALEETLRRVFYMIIALITISEMNTAERMGRLWRWILLAAWVAIGYGVLQYLDSRLFKAPIPGLDPFIWRQAFGHRVFSTYGNPNFYGNFLVIVTPLILAAVLRGRGSVLRPFILAPLMLIATIAINNITINLYGWYDSSLQIVFVAVIGVCLGLLLYFSFTKSGSGVALPGPLILFSLLFLNIISTETKGAWVGFTAALSATAWLIFEYFLHAEEKTVEDKRYFTFLVVISSLFGLLLTGMFLAFVLPLLKGDVEQLGFQFLWIPTLGAAIASVAAILWLMRKPWHLKKVIYGCLIFFVLAMGALVLQFAKTRLVSVSFRIFTWISTWEMIETNPILGNGVGTFKVIYPAFRRPQIIVLEAKSNTETDHAEDEYLEVWQDEGIVGFGIMLWMILFAIVLGLKQLRWYSRIRGPDSDRKRKILDIESDPRSYEVLGYLGAYIGALIHWFVDVSIRFVSSGIFSGLLPAVLVAYAKNHANPVLVEKKLSYERWIRLGVAALWTAVLISVKMELVPQSFILNGDTSDAQIIFWCLAAGGLIFLLLELVEIGATGGEVVASLPPLPEHPASTLAWRVPVLVGALALSGWGIYHFRLHFLADVHHNVAIFFSKEGIWTKAPTYDSKIMSFPIDIREKYLEVGGALDHYREVNAKNNAYPMAHYFTGNVYNDWGSQMHGDAVKALNEGRRDDAERMREKAFEMWDKAEAAYTSTKGLAPNYVQTHHQVGILMVKRAELASAFGDSAGARKYYDAALKEFYKYKMLDPVFPPNYDRIVQIELMDGKVETAIKLYKEALVYNDQVAMTIHKYVFGDRCSAISISLAKLYYNEALKKHKDPFHPLAPEVEEALTYFKKATEYDKNNLEAWKGYGFILDRMGRSADAQQALRKAYEIAPNDPDLRSSAPQK